MAKGNLAACLSITLPHEGGWSDHPKDPGGATMKGITLATYRAFRPGATKDQLRMIANSEVEMIYRDGYWKKINGERLPAGIDAATFDYAVNSGVGRASRELQASVGMNNIDGVIGPATANRVAAADGRRVIQALCKRRLSFMQSLKIWNTFKRGWSRRVADVEARAVAMWLKSRDRLDVSVALQDEADTADASANKQKAAATTTAGGGVTAGGADTIASGDVNWWLICGIGVAVVVVVALIAVHVAKNRERAKAYRAVAAEQ